MKINLQFAEVKLIVTNNENTTLYSYRAENVALSEDLKAIVGEAKRLITEAAE